MTIIISTIIAFNLRFDFEIPEKFIASIISITLFLIFLRVSLFSYFKVYNISWRHFGFKDTYSIVYLSVFSTFLLIVVVISLKNVEIIIPRSIIAIEFFISLVMFLAVRISKRLYLERHSVNINGKSTIIIADIDRANNILRAINTQSSDYYPIAIINEEYEDVKMDGIEAHSFDEFIKLGLECEVAIVDEAIEISTIFDKLNKQGISNIKISSGYGDYGAQINDVSVEDLLARNPKDLDKEKISSFIQGKIILVTGAGGSIGSEICRQCELYGAKKLILLDNSEYNLYSIEDEINNIETVAIMQSVVDKDSLEQSFNLHKPELVIHAAAYKHVPLVEANANAAIVNNIIGSKNIIDTAIKYGVKKLVMISTDKAVRPTNIMGTTKRICELYAQNSNGNGTDIVAVRFGNVLGSSGSVIPKFRAQIKSGKNITVTHPDITRYFMLIPEACELVLQAGAIGTGGEIFILDMGEPIKIVDLAKKMIELSGKPNINIEFTGLRPGEKLYEELLIDDSDAKTEYESITVAKPTLYDIDTLNRDIDELIHSPNQLEKLKEIVPEFNHQTN
ncbi:NAD-dependent epimerase/dehydratase family protein [Sulfurimonas aquatica]|uniref:NAD-dependent epimerase/dehydratase family protein n=1 Tax=Sulfurimonas aquatica TaxID=2672570 RepID=A0A975AZP1_9BACT|nr:nucleoside-diphosphate sugar epimerase/dehydratase [Sulfurimonas aquatica]QSZ41448.1 NAD-dependent epimerase/dehydratase family protein [Sulfurimonas aquatica]